MSNDESTGFFTVKQIAAKLQISLSMVYAMIARGELACHEFGSCKRIRAEDLEAFLSTNRKEGIRRRPRSRGKHF